MHRRSGFPPIAWASVDGTYIKIRCPVIEDALYNCRKFFTSLNVMMFGGNDLSFLETPKLIILFLTDRLGGKEAWRPTHFS